MGFSGFPSKETETRLRAGLDGEWLGPGDLTLVPGIGLHGRASALTPGTLLLDGPLEELRAPSSLYVPDLSTLDISGLVLPDSPMYLSRLEAIIVGDPPAAGTDGANHWTVDVDAPIGFPGSRSLPLDTSDGRLFAYDSRDPQQVGAFSGMSGGNYSYVSAFAFAFEAAAPITFDTITLAEPTITTTGSDPAGTVVLWQDAVTQVRVLTGDMSEVLSVAPYASRGWAGADTIDWHLESTVEMAQGDVVYVAVETTDSDVGIRFERTQVGSDGLSASGSWAGADRTLYPGYSIPHTSTGRIAAGITPDVTDTDRREDHFDNAAEASAGGTGSGVEIGGGSFRLHSTQVGTPPNTPTNVNLRLLWTA